jgi:transcriptional regulator with PAS, ATPase and Fis domain
MVKSVGIIEISKRVAVAERCKQAFLSGIPCSFAELTDGIYEAWLRSRLAGVEAERACVAVSQISAPSPTLFATVSRVGLFPHAGDADFAELISDLGGALFRLDSQLTITDASGNAEELSLLSSRGMVPGASLKEDSAGANAASVAACKKSDALFVGPESYCEIFSGHVCFAAYFRIAGTCLKNPFIITLALVPLSCFSPTFVAACAYHAESVRESLSLTQHPHIKLQQCMTKAHAHAHKTMTILIDKDDIVVDIDEELCRLYGSYIDEVRGINAYTMMPDHAHLFERVKGGETIRDYNYICKAEPIGLKDHEFYMTLVPIYDEEQVPHEYIGFACTIMRAQHMRNQVNRLMNPGARLTFDDLLGNDENFVLIKNLAFETVDSHSNVLLCGESGTGKEILAQAIHNASLRGNRPFVSVNCAAIPKELLGRELFGSIEHSAQGGHRTSVSGRFEQANQGTLFLDEIAEMSLDMQALLLQALEERKITRVGDIEARNVDVRIIAATNRNLTECIKAGTFRFDLYYRLNVVRLDMPPLRERAGDIALLANYFLSEYRGLLKKDIRAITPEALAYLQRYDWPGNIRELCNVIERCVNIGKESEITVKTLPAEIVKYQATGVSDAPSVTVEYAPSREGSAFGGGVFDSFERAESDRIKMLMRRHRGNKSLVAQEMGMARATLYRKLEKISDWESAR